MLRQFGFHQVLVVRFAAAAIVAWMELDVAAAQSELPVSADSIQTQQIVLGLTRDGLQAMASEIPKNRRIRIATERCAGDTARFPSICRSIAETHEGCLHLEHPPEGGASFEPVLRLARAHHV